MVMGLCHGQIEQSTMENGLTIWHVVRVLFTMLTATSTKACGQITKQMARVFTKMSMMLVTKVNGKMINNMVTV